MIHALVIGCGNIGAEYDLHTTDVWTHAKVFNQNPRISFSVLDQNEGKARVIGERYGVKYYTELNDNLLISMDLVSICTPTASHFAYLNQIAKYENCFCICEKPIASSLEDLNFLNNQKAFANRIVVNYIRRFQPDYQVLKSRIERLLEKDKISAIIIKYNRGLLNNGGHALDLLLFLFSSLNTFELSEVKISDYVFDSFNDDPTVAATALLNSNIPISLVGIKNAEYQIFELELFFQSHIIFITESGNCIRYFQTKNSTLQQMEDWNQNDAMKDYMIPVLDYTLNVMEQKTQTNFTEALLINQIILKNFLTQI